MAMACPALEEASAHGIDLNQNAFLLIHGWTVTPLLLELLPFLSTTPTPATATAVSDVLGGVKAGPLAIALRSCCALGLVQFHAGTATTESSYSLIPEATPGLVELLQVNKDQILDIYAKAKPPFKIPSEASSLCLELWQKLRNVSLGGMSILLQGIALAPLLTSITYNARWTEQGLDLGREKAFNFDFTSMDVASLTILGEIFGALGIGQVDQKGVVEVSPKGYVALQRVYSYYVPTSYAPLLSHFHHVLFEDASWGFNVEEDEDGEIHVDRTLNVVGSGAQHTSLFKDLLKHVHQVFAHERFDEQPQFVIDTGCGDGHLLQCIYEHVKNHTPRGKVLETYPLTMVGVDFNEKSRIATACNLDQHQVPNRVISGDIGKPSALLAQLKRKKVNPKKALHVRSFLDHDRPYIAAKNPIAADSALAAFVRSQLADFVHLDKEGMAIEPLELFASLVEHMARWGDALEDSFGLCMLEVMQLDVPSTKDFMNDCVSFHFDIVQSLSRQYMVSAVSFAMSCAMAGLFPTDCRSVQTYPETGGYCRMLNQHLQRKNFRIRLAEPSDFDALEALERKAWAKELQATSEVLRQRLETCPTGNLVVEVDGKIASVLYTQRIGTLPAVDSQKFMKISESHDPRGHILQLIAISTDPDAALGLGSELRAFALLLAKLDPSLHSVIGVTRCSDFDGDDMAKYVAAHEIGAQTDKTLAFHTGYGAQILRLVHEFRPEDVKNRGTGVLIQYDIKSWMPLLPDALYTAGTTSVEGTASTEREEKKSALQTLRDVLTEMQHPLEDDKLETGFFMLGLDSLELVRVRNRLSDWAGRQLPATFLLDFPSVADAAAELERQHGTVNQQLSALDMIKQIFSDLKCPLSEDQMQQGFFQLGIDSLEMIRVRNRLSKWLGTELSPTILLDFPSVLDLATELDHRHHRGGSATNGGVTNGTQAAAGGGYVAEKEEVKFEKLAVDKELLIQVQKKLKEKYSSAQNQRKITSILAKSSDPKALEALRMEVEASVLLNLGIIDDLQQKSVEKGRKDVEKSLKRLRQLPEVADCEQEVLKLLNLEAP